MCESELIVGAFSNNIRFASRYAFPLYCECAGMCVFAGMCMCVCVCQCVCVTECVCVRENSF